MTGLLNLPMLIGLIAVALTFDFLNGLHDTANSIATLVSTRMLRPRYAVIWAAFFNFIAFLIFGVHVARTIGVGIVAADVMDAHVIFGALMGAIAWNLITWWGGIPSSSSHALIGGLVGAGVLKAGIGAIVWPGLLTTGAFIVLSPLLGFFLALMLVLAVSWIFVRANPRTVEPTFHWLQFGAASLISLGHGGNDAQKTMGIITLALITTGGLSATAGTPLWVVAACAGSIALGTSVGGWRVIRTVGKGITEITSTQGFAAESVSSAVILGSAHFGFAVSTTQVTSGSVLGVGLGKRAPVRWRVAAQMVVAWIVTIPAAAAFGGAANAVARGFGGLPGVFVTGALALAVYTSIYLVSRRQPVTATNVNDPIPVGARSALAFEPVAA